MAIVGHWCVAFLCGWLLPGTSTTLLCKLTMLSDTTFGFLGIFGLERGGIYVDWMSTPPPGTVKLIEEWKRNGLWQEGFDQEQGEDGFEGFVPCCFYAYADIAYSHSVELMAILAVPAIAYLRLRHKISAGYALAVFVCLVTHPMIDMLFHDGYFRMGNRSQSRVSLAWWQMPWNAPWTFTLEAVLAYASYRLWRSARVPVRDDDSTAKDVADYEKMFLSISLSHNLASWYVLAPALAWVFWKVWPQLGYGADTYWTYWFMACTMWSWAVALYPLHKLEKLTAPKECTEAEAPYMHLKV